MRSIIKKTAKQYGVSVKEVRRDIQETIKYGMMSTEPEAVKFWSQFNGKEPTPEQFISALSSMARAEIV